MRAGFHSVGLCRRSLADAIALVAAAGYDAIEINTETLPWADPHMTPATGDDVRETARQTAERAGTTISSISAHIPMMDSAASSRRAAIDFVKGCNRLARDLGAPIVHILSGPAPAGASQAEAWRWFADAVAESEADAAAQGVLLAIEAIAGHLFHETDDFSRLAADLPGTPIRVNYDPSHLIVQGEDPLRLIAERGHEIVNVHMKDGKGRFPDFSFPPLGAGAIDFSALVAALRKAGYDGILSVEYEAQVFGFHQSEAEILAHGRGFLRHLGV